MDEANFQNPINRIFTGNINQSNMNFGKNNPQGILHGSQNICSNSLMNFSTNWDNGQMNNNNFMMNINQFGNDIKNQMNNFRQSKYLSRSRRRDPKE